MTNFNFKVSIAQLVVVVLTTPLVMLFCKKFERFTLPSMITAQQQPQILEFARVYLSEGLACITSSNTKDGE